MDIFMISVLTIAYQCGHEGDRLSGEAWGQLVSVGKRGYKPELT